MKNIPLNPYFLLTLASLFWAGNFVLSKAMSTQIPPVTLAFGRWTLAFLFVLPFAYAHLRRDRQTLLRHWKILLPVSLLGITAFNTMIYVGLQSTTAINSLLLQSFFPVVIPALAFLFFREKLSGRQVIGIAVSLAGTLWLVSQGEYAAAAQCFLQPGRSVGVRSDLAVRYLRAATAVSAVGTSVELSGYHVRTRHYDAVSRLDG